MPNAKVNIRQQDRSALVPALSGIAIGTVVDSKWGSINPSWVTNPNKFPSSHGEPDNSKGSSWNGAELLLANSNKVLITRAIHEDALHSAALVRFKTDPVDFNSIPAPDAKPDPVIKPVKGGIGIDGIDSYQFPMYSTDRVYEASGINISEDSTDSTKVRVDSLTTTSGHTLEEDDKFSIADSPDNDSDFWTIDSVEQYEEAVDTVVTDEAVSGDEGTELQKMDGGVAVSYSTPVYLIAEADSTTQLQVDDSDLVLNGDEVTLDGGTTTAVVQDKNIYNKPVNELTLTTSASFTKDTEIQYMVEDEVEYRDAFLVVGKYLGDKGDDFKIGIRHSKNYDEAFHIDVFVNGVQEETFEVTRKPFLDGFGNQMFVEDKVNGVSEYIHVLHNDMDEGQDLPKETDQSIWRQKEYDIFEQTNVLADEDLVAGDTEVTVTDATSLSLGSRIKFGSADGSEYKVLEVSGNSLVIDREIQEDKVDMGTAIYLFDETKQDEDNGIYDGVQYYAFTALSPMNAYSIGDTYELSDDTGTILDAGYNNLAGGFDGSNVTLFDVVKAFAKMNNKEKYRVSVFCDNGFSYPEVAISLEEMNRQLNVAHGFLSTPYNAELQSDSVAACVEYRNSTNLNSEYVSMFSGWIQVADTFNQTRVWVAPSVFAVNAQSFVTRDYQIFTPAAGWVTGRVNGLQITNKWDDGQRDLLIDAQINPIRSRDGFGLAIWGNETMYVKPGPLQLRSVAMLLIVLKYGLEEYLEFELFDFNNEETWTTVESAISTFVRDELYSPGGLYDFVVTIQDVITDSDIDNRRMPIFVGIQPTMDIQTIPATIGVFNRSVEISV